MRKLLAPFVLIAALFSSPGWADWTAKDAAGATATFKNPGTCTSVVCTPIAAIADSTGVNLAVIETAGADAVSNTRNGLLVYNRMQVYNGTTWDRWQGAVTATLAAETTKVIGTVRVASGGVASGSFASGSIASGAVASGAIASGAVAAGALAAGAGVDGWDLTQGAIADAAATQGSTGSISAKLRTVTSQLNTGNGSLATIATNSALPLPAQTGIGNVNIGAVQSAGSGYETVAASQTAQVMGATGATGDYLSHCVIYPVTTGAGAVTVFDNANAATTNVITFTSGTLSNLAPIAIPVGALSTAGAWKVTTGANVTVTCYGKFT